MREEIYVYIVNQKKPLRPLDDFALGCSGSTLAIGCDSSFFGSFAGVGSAGCLLDFLDPFGAPSSRSIAFNTATR